VVRFMTKPVAESFNRPDADLHEDRRRPIRTALETLYEGYSTINLNPAPGLRRFRCELENYSDEAVGSAWGSTRRALAAAVGAELHLHDADEFAAAPGIKAILERAQAWDQPDHPDQADPETKTELSAVAILLEGPDGPMQVTIPMGSRRRLLDILKAALATEPLEK
jgi:hypothetical protein